MLRGRFSASSALQTGENQPEPPQRPEGGSAEAPAPSPFSLPSSPLLSKSHWEWEIRRVCLAFRILCGEDLLLRSSFIKNVYAESNDGREEEAGGGGKRSWGGSFSVSASEDAVLSQTSARPPAFGPTTAWDGAPAPPPRSAPPGLRIAPGSSPSCSRPSSVALLPSTPPRSPPAQPLPQSGVSAAPRPEPFGVTRKALLQNGHWGLVGRRLRSQPISKMAAAWLRLGNPAPARRGGWAPCSGREGRADAIFPERGCDIEGSVGGWKEGDTGAAAAVGFVHRSQGKGASELVPVGFYALS